MPYMPFMNTPAKLAAENRVGETEEEMKKRVHKEVQRSFRKKKINAIKHWIYWRTICVPRRVRIKLWALKHWDRNGGLSLAETEDCYYQQKMVDKANKELKREIKKMKKNGDM